MRTQITEATLRSPVRNKSGDEIWDKGVLGFGIRKFRPGMGSYFVRYVDLAGQRRRKSIGKFPAMSLPDARELALDILMEGRSGGSPEALLEQKTIERLVTVEQVVEAYLRDYVATNHKRPHDTRNLLNKYFVSELGGQSIHRLTPVTLQALVNKVAKKTPAQARKIRAYGSKLFSWAQTDPRIRLASNPMKAVVASIVKPRDRFLDANELRAVLQAARSMPDPFRGVVELLLRTGLRLDEVASLEWSRYDPERKHLHLGSGDTKNKSAFTIPLPEQCVEIIKRQSKKGRYVFASPRTGRPMSGWSKLKARLNELTDAFLADADLDPAEPWRMHDFRRSVVTVMAEELGVDIAVADRLLNHLPSATLTVVGRTYQKTAQLPERRDALVRYGAWLDDLLGEGNVVTLPKPEVTDVA